MLSLDGKILDLLKSGMSLVGMDRKVSKNESSNHTINQKEVEICRSVCALPTTAKCFIWSVLKKTAKALSVWLDDMSKKHIPKLYAKKHLTSMRTAVRA